MPATATIAELQRFLLRHRNADGGWGYYAGKASRLEPTCWAALALGDRLPAADLRSVIERWPVRDGLLLERANGLENIAFHALALLTLLALQGTHQAGNAHLLEALQQAKGVRLPPSRINRQDDSLQAWSWISGTFSWVEPTAWCLLALKKSQRQGSAINAARVHDGEAVLLDRCCVLGGWNYGNSNMLGKELRPYVPTTGVALLAMRDRVAEPAISRSVTFLENAAVSERSALALALALIALRTFGRPYDEVYAALTRQVSTTLTLGNQFSAALSLYALRTDHGDAALAL